MGLAPHPRSHWRVSTVHTASAGHCSEQDQHNTVWEWREFSASLQIWGGAKDLRYDWCCKALVIWVGMYPGSRIPYLYNEARKWKQLNSMLHLHYTIVLWMSLKISVQSSLKILTTPWNRTIPATVSGSQFKIETIQSDNKTFIWWFLDCSHWHTISCMPREQADDKSSGSKSVSTLNSLMVEHGFVALRLPYNSQWAAYLDLLSENTISPSLCHWEST